MTFESFDDFIQKFEKRKIFVACTNGDERYLVAKRLVDACGYDPGSRLCNHERGTENFEYPHVLYSGGDSICFTSRVACEENSITAQEFF